MSATLTPITRFRGEASQGEVTRYVETSPSVTYYVTAATPLASQVGGAVLIVDPATYLDANQARWGAEYARIMDKLVTLTPRINT